MSFLSLLSHFVVHDLPMKSLPCKYWLHCLSPSFLLVEIQFWSALEKMEKKKEREKTNNHVDWIFKSMTVNFKCAFSAKLGNHTTFPIQLLSNMELSNYQVHVYIL